jgi:hypothetical protein
MSSPPPLGVEHTLRVYASMMNSSPRSATALSLESCVFASWMLFARDRWLNAKNRLPWREDGFLSGELIVSRKIREAELPRSS